MATIGTDILKAVDHLKRGELVAMPTETVYGLAGNALDEDAVLRIFEAKQRPSFDPLIVHCADFNRASAYVDRVPRAALELAKVFTPGPLTMILPKRSNVPDLVTSGHRTVGIRIPRHPMAQDLLQALDFPLAAPSANPFGYVSPTTAEHVENQLGEHIPYILDGGPCAIGLESTIVSFEGDQPVVLRLGGLALEELEEALGEKVKAVRTSSSRPEAPGMLSAHYAPGMPVHLMPWSEGQELALKAKSAGLICLQRPSGTPDHIHVVELAPDGNLNKAAQGLFAALRAMDEAGVELIIAEPMPDSWLGRAMNDRLKRAAAGAS